MAPPREHPTDPLRSPRDRERLESEGFLGCRGELVRLGAQSTLAKERGARC